PSPILTEIQVSQDVKVLSLGAEVREKFSDLYALRPAVIPAGTYKNQDKDVSTLSLFTAMAANKNVSEEAVYQITGAMIKRAESVRAMHPSFSTFDPATAWHSLGGPLH